MDHNIKIESGHAQSCTGEEIDALLTVASDAVLFALLQNPALSQAHLRVLIRRRDLTGLLLERVAAKKEWTRDPALRRALVAHLHTPLRVAMKLAGELEVMELSAISLQSTVPAEMRRFADDLLLTHMAQLQLGQKLALGRRGPGRVAAELLLGGDERIARAVLENAHLTEPQLLRVLANGKLSAAVIALVAVHAKWSCLVTVRSAVIRHRQASVEQVMVFLPELPLAELSQMLPSAELRAEIREAIRVEIQSRSATGSRSLPHHK